MCVLFQRKIASTRYAHTFMDKIVTNMVTQGRCFSLKIELKKPIHVKK